MYKNKVEVDQKKFFFKVQLFYHEKKKKWDLQKHFSCSLPYFYVYLPWILPIIECKVLGYFVLVLFGKNFNITSCCWAFFLKNSWKLICECFFFIFFFHISFAKKMFLLKIWCENDDISLMMLFFSLYQAKMGGVSP